MFDSWLYSMPPIRSERLELRSVLMRDAKDLFETCRDPQVARYVLWDAHPDIGRTRDYIRFLHRRYRQGDAPTFAIVLVEENKVIGTISFITLDRENRCAELGYSLNRAYWNRGFATEALKAMIAYAFTEWRLNRIEAMHDVRNPASGRVMEKAGMKPEGVLREKVYLKGKYADVRLYSILRRESGK